MLEMKHVSKTFNPGTVNEKKALCDLNLVLEDGDFATIVGSNGAGKSTLLRSLIGELRHEYLELAWGRNVKTGYYDQENKDMQPRLTVLEELWRRVPAWPEQNVRGMLGRLLLTGDDVYKKVEMLISETSNEARYNIIDKFGKKKYECVLNHFANCNS